MIELFDFQQKAAATLAERTLDYMTHPIEAPGRRGEAKRIVPFYQALGSVTASGKTLILANAIHRIASPQPVKPVVLWLSKGKVVVSQTFDNLRSGGKYSHLLPSTRVRYLGEFNKLDLEAADESALYLATVATFNQSDKSNLRIYRSGLDTANKSVWDQLKKRTTVDGKRRRLVVVYDEGHNLTIAQTQRLLELEPDALLVASATLRLDQELGKVIDRLLDDQDIGEEDLQVLIPSSDVVETGLVKREVELVGYETSMEEALDGLVGALRETEKATRSAKGEVPPPPKAIYVCRTNVVEGTNEREDPAQPFGQRKAPPILIWRRLTDHHGVDPSDVAVYCALDVDSSFPLPSDFNLFAGGESDYQDFIQGEYRHIIFNLGLQEGWDDPACYFAYIDKSMESQVQIEQVIGRVLRQPNVQHYSDERLNRASFYVRVDQSGTFQSVVDDVSDRLGRDLPEISFEVRSSNDPPPRETVEPELDVSVPRVAIDAIGTLKPIAELVEQVSDYRYDTTNTVASGLTASVRQEVGKQSDGRVEWQEVSQGLAVSARWLLRQEVAQSYPRAIQVADISGPKFDAKVQLRSRAHQQLKDQAAKIVASFIVHARLSQQKDNPYNVGPVSVSRDYTRFNNSVHGRYSDLNEPEKDFARALDRTGLTWCRNPSKTGYSVPLPNLGQPRRFFPDFIAWNEEDIYLLDPTGEHLIRDKLERKLLSLRSRSAPSLHIRLVSKGTWKAEPAELERPDGYTVWRLSEGHRLEAVAAENVDEAVEYAADAGFADL